MGNIRVKILINLLAIILFANNCFANAEHHKVPSENNNGIKQQVKESIKHHLLDTYDFVIWHAVGIEFPLPILLIDNGLHVFMSSKFHHGEAVAESNGNYYKVEHAHIYKTDAAGTINMDEHHHVTNATPLDFSITKNVVIVLMMAIFMFFLFQGIAKNYKNTLVPQKAGKFLEPIIIYIRDEIAIPNIGEKHYKKYMSHLLTVFFFIWFINLTGLTPFGFNVTGNISITFSLALVTFFITQFTAKKNYWQHIFWMPGVPLPMKFLLAPIELLGVFIKPFALMIRLYANMKAGHVVLMSIIGLMFLFKSWIGSPLSFGLAFALSLLELLVALLQAYIFTMLTALYYGSASAEHTDH